jgi:putative ATP-dependent endonuclease of OLD family
MISCAAREPTDMILKQVILRNFRSYRTETRIDTDDFTTFIGKNDAGKSTILEALEIFFNQELIKMEPADVSAGNDSQEVLIGCIFAGAADMELVLDDSARTTLRSEYLLNSDGDLEIHKVFDCGAARIKDSVHAVANHPVREHVDDLLFLKNAELKKRATTLGIVEENMDRRSNPSIRSAIWRSIQPLATSSREVPLDKEDAKKIWEGLKKHLPLFALFRADRPSRDEDSEVQDPMKVAVQEALKDIQSDLEEIERVIREKTSQMASQTIEKLREIAPHLAGQITPEFRADRKWDQLFKISLKGENDIPINKRGSGVRRLILLSFFRASAERKKAQLTAPTVIYAIEEPETSQHPTQQKLLMEALLELVDESCQILVTTHNPALAGLVPVESIRYVHVENGQPIIRKGQDILQTVANDLGVLADHRIKALVCVEGPHDVTFLRCISQILHAANNEIIDLENDPRVAVCPIGGSSLLQWVAERYLKGFNRPEVHLYDAGTEIPPTFQSAVDQVNRRTDGSYAALTGKREIENYLHPDAIQEEFDIRITFGDTDRVPEIVAAAIHDSSPGATRPWADLDHETKEKKISSAKKRLNLGAVKRMTLERLQIADPNQRLENWLQMVGQACRRA